MAVSLVEPSDFANSSMSSDIWVSSSSLVIPHIPEYSLVHRNIGDIIQFAEDTELRKPGDTGEEDKAEIWVAILQWTIRNYA